MTKPSLDVSLLRRQIGERRHHTSVKTLYGHKEWVDDLDIVNELGAHTGCVNALSWSKSGRLLASGSDDTHLNIWSYHPESQSRPFSLNTSVSTGHVQNIFSVKFMPHSNDRTVITAAGDAQVRVFDIEYGGSSAGTSADSGFPTNTRSRRFNSFFSNARFLNDGNTNARVYRSHQERVKRIVTESSPHLFLTCSEDGEVRQWDLRQPSSAYPSSRGSRRGNNGASSDIVPPPLISYKRYALDLNSISCSGSQPQYIALGGAHLHCFLHDRRMLGRDLAGERGQRPGKTSELGSRRDENMDEATRCVRRFAPNEKRKMGQHDNGHITACKISDANPNEMVASWSGDHIYSFDLVQSPDARDAATASDKAFRTQEAETKLKHHKDRKRKRTKATGSSSSLTDSATASRRLRRVADDHQELGHTALRVRYGNGETEDLPVGSSAGGAPNARRITHDTLLTEAQKLSERIAKALVALRKTMFDFASAPRNSPTERTPPVSTTHTATYTSALGQATSLLMQMDEVIRTWSYPINPTSEVVTLQQTMQRNRQASWRFVQASGCLAKSLGGRIQTLSPAEDPRIALFEKVRPAAREGNAIEDGSRFCYDFLKAILLWLNGGKEALVEGFRRPSELNTETQRFPLEPDGSDGIDDSIEKISRYLRGIASAQRPIINLDANFFERDEFRILCESQSSAVESFLSFVGETTLLRDGSSPDPQRKDQRQHGDACKYWGEQVGRALLMDAGEGVNYEFVKRAFGGLALHRAGEIESVADSGARSMVTTDPEHAAVEESSDGMLDASGAGAGYELEQEAGDRASSTIEEGNGDIDEDAHQSEDDDDDDNDEDNEEEEADDDDEEGDADATFPIVFRQRAAFGRSRERALVNRHVPYSSHTRTYKGHCNVKTVKDVNFYGLDDEYVVSGSDDGYFFLWDRKTTELVNILEGDGEVVNVVQGHPYEPMIAVSGIDSTIKIFGSGGRERDDADRGANVANPGGGRHSSLRMFGRRRRGRGADDDIDGETADTTTGLRSRKAMHKSYEILSQNDLSRRRGVEHAFLTRDMLARLAAQIDQGHLTINPGGPGGEGATIVVDENCATM